MTNSLDELKAARSNPNAQRYLRMLQQAEGTYKGADGNPYAVAFGGETIADLSKHPKVLREFTQTDGKANKTSAAGAYQFLGGTWADVAGKLGLQDFGPESQDLAALELIRRNGSLQDVLAGNFDKAVQRDGRTWASLPSSPYAQPRRSQGFIEQALEAALPSAHALPSANKEGAPMKTQAQGVSARAAFEQAMRQYQQQGQIEQPTPPAPTSEGQPAPQASAGGGSARAAFEAAMQQHKGRGANGGNAPEPQPQKRGLLGEIGRQVGLTGRYAIEGLGHAADLVAEPINNLTRMAGAEATAPSKTFSRLADTIGLPKPGGGTLEAMGAGAGGGFGQVVAGAEHYAGAALDAFGADALGQRLKRDAAETRERIKQDLQPYRQSNPVATTVGEFTGNVAATMPVGGVLGKGMQTLGGFFGAGAKVAPVAQAISTGGMSAGSATGAAGLATRVAGGAITGGASAALVNPEDAATGAAIGAALPVAGKAMGKLSDLAKGKLPNAQTLSSVRKATDAGFVLPPSHARPTLANGLMEGVGGKIKTQQAASIRNQQTTNKLVKQALGLADDVELTPQALANMRRQAGQAYEGLRGMGTVQTDKAFLDAVNDIGAQYANASRSFPGLVPDNGVDTIVQSLSVKSMDASSAVDAIHVLREQAKSAYSAGNGATAKAANKAAQALEDVLERQLSQTGGKTAVSSFKEARQQIAKIYEAEKALHPGSGNIDARKLAASLRKGKPLSGEIRQVAEAADAFPKAFQGPEAVGSVAPISVLDSAFAGGVGLTTGSTVPLAMLAVRPAMRAAALSPMVQRGLSVPPGAQPLSVLAKKAAPAIYRAAPVAGANP